MITASKIDQRPQVRRRIDKLKLPLNRPSILDPSLDSDPWIDYSPRANKCRASVGIARCPMRSTWWPA